MRCITVLLNPDQAKNLIKHAARACEKRKDKLCTYISEKRLPATFTLCNDGLYSYWLEGLPDECFLHAKLTREWAKDNGIEA